MDRSAPDLDAEPAAIVAIAVRRGEVVLGPVAPGSIDLGLIDVLARLHVAARRAGGALRLRDPSPELCELLELVGLSGVLVPLATGAPALPLQAGGQAEGGEQLGAEEVVDPGDAIA
jgi:hypothetical protein